MGNSEDKLFVVGEYKAEFNNILKIQLPCKEIYQSEGLKMHIEKRHSNCLQYMKYITQIINDPQYVGLNPKEPNSIELVKKYDENVLIAIKLDKRDDYLYVASIYDVKESKIERRLHSGRLKSFQLDKKNEI